MKVVRLITVKEDKIGRKILVSEFKNQTDDKHY